MSISDIVVYSPGPLNLAQAYSYIFQSCYLITQIGRPVK